MSTYQECGAGSLVKHLKFVGLIAQYIYYDSKLVGPVVYFASAWDARAEQHAYLVHLISAQTSQKEIKCTKVKV